MDKDEYFMNEALKEALKARRASEVPVGTIIVLGGKIIARGHNKRQIKGDITKHAELIAIRRASKKLKDWRLNDCIMYVTLAPCPMCASAIVQSRIKKLVIGTKSNDINSEIITNLIYGVKQNKKNIQIKENVLEDECSMILKEFFKERR